MSRVQPKHRRSRSRFGEPRRATWWINQSYRDRREAVVSLGNRIRADRSGFGVFCSHQYIPGTWDWTASGGTNAPDTPAQHWADITFASGLPTREGRATLFNATVLTVADRVFHALEDRADEDVEARLTPESKAKEEAQLLRPWFKPIPGKKGFSELILPTHEGHEELGGLTVRGATGVRLQELLAELESNPTATATVSAKLDRAYRYGVGLTLVVDAIGLSGHALVRAIDEFRARGEQAYEDTVPLAPHLPAIRAMVAFHAWIAAKIDAKDRGLEPPAPFDPEAFPLEERIHLSNGSVAIKG